MFKATILTIFPNMFPGPLGLSLAGKALEKGSWDLNIVDIRDFSLDKYQTVDDKPFGGGNGMVMRPDVLGPAIESVKTGSDREKIIYFSPRGTILSQNLVREYKEEYDHLILICGRFEGIDERVIEEYGITEISLGDFILSGGEIAAYALLDSIIRQLPNVLENPLSLIEESFGEHEEFGKLLEYPHFTRPQMWKEHEVPQILLSGDHDKISKWRLEQSKKITKERREDLWRKYNETDLI